MLGCVVNQTNPDGYIWHLLVLNQDFIHAAFNTSEQAAILTTHLENPDNPFNSIDGGDDTDDKIFLLGLSDVYGEDSHYKDDKWYFNNNSDRKAMATKYAVVNRKVSAYNHDEQKWCNETNFQTNKCSSYWWLRSPGIYANYAALVIGDGFVNYDGISVDGTVVGVRPALYVQY